MTPEFNYAELVAEARRNFKWYIWERERMYAMRAAQRAACGCPTLVIVGAGKSGKDEVGKLLMHHCGLAYEGGTSRIFAPMIAASLGQDMETAYAQRRENRDFWFNWMTAYREGDPAGVARLQLAKSDFCSGIRGEEELRTCVDQYIVNVPVWVEREGCHDGAHEVSPELVKELDGLILDNNGDLSNLECNVVAMAQSLGLPFVHRQSLYEVNRG